MNDKIRIGLLIDSFVMPAWITGMVKKITEIDKVEIAVIIVAAPDNHHDSSGWGYRFYKGLDNILYKTYPNADQATDLYPLVKNIPQVNVSPLISEKKKEIGHDDVNIISGYHPDVLIKLGFENLSGEILDLPKLGVWSLDCFKEKSVNLSPGALQFFNNNEITPSAVKILSGDPATEKILYQSFSMTDKKSLNRNLNKVYWKSLSFIPRLLSLLSQNGENWFWEYIKQNNDNLSGRMVLPGGVVSNGKTLQTLINKYFGEIANRIKGLFHPDRWNLFYHVGESDHIETKAPAFKKIPCPKGAFWADPHVVNFNNSPFIFFEEWDHKKKKGHISAIEFTNGNTVPAVLKVLEKPYHLSYPFIFQWKGMFYMIPETASNRTIELYQCKNFPGEWVFVMNLMENIHAVDTTLYFYDNKWWLFANIVENAGASSLDELFIFCADDFLTTDWSAHKLNPLVSDARNARPAGAIFSINGKIYRPSQCSDKIYGRSVNINEVITLTESNFLEINGARLVPGGAGEGLGIHSYSKLNQLTVIDIFCHKTNGN